jgi:hypothetical protein
MWSTAECSGDLVSVEIRGERWGVGGVFRAQQNQAPFVDMLERLLERRSICFVAHAHTPSGKSGEEFAPDCILHHPVRQFRYLPKNHWKVRVLRGVCARTWTAAELNPSVCIFQHPARGFEAMLVYFECSDFGFQRGRAHAEFRSSTRGAGHLAACFSQRCFDQRLFLGREHLD